MDNLTEDSIDFSMNIPASTYYIEDRVNKIIPIGPVLMCGIEGASFLNKGIYSNERKDLKIRGIKDLKLEEDFRQGDTLRFKVVKNNSLYQMKVGCGKESRINCDLVFD